MSDKKQKALPDNMPEIKFNLEAQESFARSRGVVFEHWSALPSPIGLKDRGDYRRSDALDTISENGFIYKKVGEFIGTILGNSRNHKFGGPADGGFYNASSARVVIPKFYENTEGKEISLLPGDRIYAKDIELVVENYQRAQYRVESSDFLQFPAKCVERLMDSRGIEYSEGRDFVIDKDGNIKWKAGKKNPGIDEETGKGRIYSVRYKYIAFWYVDQLINEIRITNTDDADTPSRMPYHAVLQREYVYHNKNRGDKENQTPEQAKEEKRADKQIRTNPKPIEGISTAQPQVKVNIKDFKS